MSKTKTKLIYATTEFLAMSEAKRTKLKLDDIEIVTTLEDFLNLSDEQRELIPEEVVVFDPAIPLGEFARMDQETHDKLPTHIYLKLQADKVEADNKEAASAMKSKHKVFNVFLLEVDDARAWLKGMDRDIIKMVHATAGDDPIEAAELLLENLWLEGDERLKKDDDYFIPAVNQLKELMQLKTARLKKY